LRSRLPDIASWGFTAAAVAATLLAIGIGALALGLGADEEGPADGPTALRELPPTGTSGTAQRSGPPAARSELEALVDRLSTERKVAQLFLLGFRGQDLTAPIFRRLRELDLGGIVIDAQNYTTADQLPALAGEAEVIARQEDHLPPWVVAPQEGGEFNAFADLPPASAAAETESAAQAFAEAKQAASALAGVGIEGVLAPVVDVAPPEGIALGGRAYSDDPREVAAYATAVVDAYRAQSVLTAAGHFPGLGLGTEDTRFGPSQVAADLDELRERDLVPFRAAIRAGVPAILMSNGLYESDDFVTPGSMSRALVDDLLRGELGFEGIAITDDLADPSVTALTSIPNAAVDAVRAGADLLYVSGPAAEQEAAYDAVLGAVRRGTISSARLEQAVLRNLAVKRDYGLLRG
jgi:beta-N-acetylhexosaminidase